MFTPSELEVLSQAKSILASKLLTNDCLTSPVVVKDYCQTAIAHYEHEVFGVLFLNQRNYLIAFVELFRGTIDGASVYPREVVKEALAQNAAAVIFTHNHPSGLCEPSSADEAITKRLVSALSMIDIRVLDHVIVGVGESVSFAERGLL
ncbi:DNA repair protein RadC [Cardiobacterium sp. AH-315-I02]|nr:DNA repair protein RadC [Cardiobacterium sp. AH-315-I02]